MPAQPHFFGRSEPAQFPVRRAAFIAHEEGGLGEIVLLRDRQQGRIIEPVVERHDCRLIAGEGFAREGIDMPIG